MPEQTQQLVKPLLQHALDVSRFWLQNATLNRGVPDKPQRLLIESTDQSPPSQQLPQPVPTTQTVIASVTPQAPASSIASGLSRLAKAGLVAATLAGGGLGGAALSYFLRPDQVIPVVTQPTDQSPQQTPTGSLLQYLEDKGYHLPAEERR